MHVPNYLVIGGNTNGILILREYEIALNNVMKQDGEQLSNGKRINVIKMWNILWFCWMVKLYSNRFFQRKF